MASLEAIGLTKTFPGVVALDGVDFSAEAGEVHAIVGANGAGKSTLMNILAGVFPPSAGEIRIAGKRVAFRSPREASDAGVSIVYQEFSAIPELTVAQNLFLGREPCRRLGVVDRRRLATDARVLLERHHIPLEPATPVEELGVAQRQLVEIARALSQAATILILDEPTAVLSAREQENLFTIIAELRAAGLLVLYVSHRLDEVFRIADRVTVLRDGRKVDTVGTDEIDQAALVRLMTGREAQRAIALPPVAATGPPLLAVRWTHDGNESVLTVRKGEIVGLAGMVGAGRSRLARGVVGLGPRGARLELDGRAIELRSPRQALRHGIIYLTEDRKREGLFSNLSVLANTSAAALDRVSRFGVLRPATERREGEVLLDRLALVARSLDSRMRELSGGNQQKVLIARALMAGPRLLICDEPTRGVDVGAKEEIYRILIDLAAQGVGVLLVSSEFKELLTVCHRIVVMRDGGVVGEKAAGEADEGVLVALATGAAGAPLDSTEGQSYG